MLKKYMNLCLIVALPMSLLVNIGLMVKYRVPPRVWRLFDQKQPPIPDIPVNGLAEYSLGGEPKLAFNDTIKGPSHLRDWQERARAKLRECLGVKLPTEPPPVRVINREQDGRVIRETLVFTQADGMEIPAFLLMADERMSAPRPTLIVIPGHSAGIVATSGMVRDYQNKIALRLAEAGYVVLTLEVRGFGYVERIGKPGLEMDRGSLVGYAIHHGLSYPGFIVGDAISALAYLQAHERVDADRIGAVGFSSGGKIAIYLAAIDPRIKALVASGSVMSFDANFRFARHGPDEAVIGLGRWLEMSDCLAMVAPRPMLVHWGELDTDRQGRAAAFNGSSLPTVQAARKAYTLTGHGDRLETFVTPGLGHVVDVEAAIEFLSRTLPLESDSDQPSS